MMWRKVMKINLIGQMTFLQNLIFCENAKKRSCAQHSVKNEGATAMICVFIGRIRSCS